MRCRFIQVIRELAYPVSPMVVGIKLVCRDWTRGTTGAEDSTALRSSLSNPPMRSARSGMRYGLGMNSIASVRAAAEPLHDEVSKMRTLG